MPEYDRTPVTVPTVETKFRTIRTPLPVPESLPIFDRLEKTEPRSMRGQPPVVWDHAEDFTVYDRWGNRWIDWSSGVLIANAGHGRRPIREALKAVIDRGLLASYVFVHEKRGELTELLQSLSPDPANYQVFLLSTGSEATENTIKLAKTYAREKHGPQKRIIVSFQNAFHGRTMGAQLAGGMPRQKEWIGCQCPCFVQVPFPDGFKNEDVSFDRFRRSLDEQGVAAGDVAGVIVESYQGVGPDFLPVSYARQLEAFCREHDAVLIMDEVQAGFGRTGRMFGYQHYGVRPDLVACGKGISSSLPLSAVLGRADIMNLYPPGAMTSTHSASPLSVVSAVENLKLIIGERLAERAAVMGDILMAGLAPIQKKHARVLGCLHGRGLVAGIQVVRPGTKEPDPATALAINVACFHKGLLMFAPVGIAGECLKICPPLTIDEAALRESIAVFQEAVEEVLAR